MDTATGSERRPTVAIDDMPEPAASVMMMSADDDDQTDQQHELADTGMAKTDRSVLEVRSCLQKSRSRGAAYSFHNRVFF